MVQVVSEYDLEIRYRPGRQNANADALSRLPLPAETDIDSLDTVQIATFTAEGDIFELAKQQREDAVLEPIIVSLENEKQEDNFALVDNVLHHCGNKDGNPLQLCVLKVDRERLLKDAHSGTFTGHFSPRAVYNTLSKQYWWKRMYWDTQAHCRGCLTCASYEGAGRRMKPPLLPIPVGGPFHRVGVDIMELPLTVHGNKYVIVFVDYLT